MIKALGAGILLLSWITQTFLFDYWSQQKDSYDGLLSSAILLASTGRIAEIQCEHGQSNGADSSVEKENGNCSFPIDAEVLAFYIPNKADAAVFLKSIQEENKPTAGNQLWTIGQFTEARLSKVDFYRTTWDFHRKSRHPEVMRIDARS